MALKLAYAQHLGFLRTHGYAGSLNILASNSILGASISVHTANRQCRRIARMTGASCSTSSSNLLLNFEFSRRRKQHVRHKEFSPVFPYFSTGSRRGRGQGKQQQYPVYRLNDSGAACMFSTTSDKSKEREYLDDEVVKRTASIFRLAPPSKNHTTSAKLVFRALAGNTAITILKFGAWVKTGSSAMLSESIHSLVDTGNQALLILGLRQSGGMPDKKHHYGYGRAAYFWSLISALGMFWLGAGVTISHGFQTLIDPPKELLLGWELWTVLGMSFAIDGYVLQRVYNELRKSQPKDMGFIAYLRTIKDPFMMAVLLEDTAACTGVILAGLGTGASYMTGNPAWDSLASISIGGLLGYVAVQLVMLNRRYLLGQSVEPAIENGIREVLMAWPSIENVYDVQSQWMGPNAFSFKAEVDFDGTYLAAKLMESYHPVFMESKDLNTDLPLLLAWYAEDVTRLVEREVKEMEASIRAKYPEAAFIELEPDSKQSYQQAISERSHKGLRKLEQEALNRAIAQLAATLHATKSISVKRPADPVGKL